MAKTTQPKILDLSDVGPGSIVEVPADMDIKQYAPPPPILKVCSTCKSWRTFPSDPVLGQCIPSAKSLPAPLITTDMASCSKWSG